VSIDMKNFFILFILLSDFIFASNVNNLGGDILNQFQVLIASWQPTFVTSGLFLLGTLSIFEIILVYGQMATKGEVDFNKSIAALVKIAFLIGLFLAFINNLDWIKSFTSGLNILGNRVIGNPISLDNIVEYAYKIWDKTGDSASILDGIGDALFSSIAGIIAAFAVIALGIVLLVTQVKFYILFTTSPLWLGFGVFQYTRQYAISTIFLFVKIGAELLFIKIIIGMALKVLPSSAEEAVQKDSSMFAVIVIAVTFFSIAKMIPSLVESIFSGSLPQNASGAGGALRQTASTATSALGGAAKGASNAITTAGAAGGGGLATKVAAGAMGAASGSAKGVMKSAGMYRSAMSGNEGMKSGKFATGASSKFGDFLKSKQSSSNASVPKKESSGTDGKIN